MLEDHSARVNNSLNRRIRMTSYLNLDWICKERVLVLHASTGEATSYRLSTSAVDPVISGTHLLLYQYGTVSIFARAQH
jgi:hypothetical protein